MSEKMLGYDVYATENYVDEKLTGIGDEALAEAKKYTDTAISNIPEVDLDSYATEEYVNSATATKLSTSLKGSANGLAELDANGKVPTTQLPSYVDDVIEGTLSTFGTGEAGKIYLDTTTNKTYRWSGSTFVEISESLALGETSSTAFRGDYGATAYAHSQTFSGNPHGTSKSDLGLGNVENKSSATIRNELTKDNVTTALGYTPVDENNLVGKAGAGVGAEIFNDYTNNTAVGIYSHAEGLNTIASGNYQHVQGQYNIEDTSNVYAHIVGNGEGTNVRSNAHTLDWDGNAWFAGDVYVGSTSGTNKDNGSKKLATIEDLSNASSASLEDAKTYTDNQIDALNVQSIDGLETALTNAETNALIDAKAYTDGKVTEINTALNGKEAAGAAAQALTNANAYTDQEIAALVGSAPETLDTIEELSAALDNNKNILTVLTDAIGLKANKATVESEISRIDTALAGKEAIGVAEAKANQALSDAKTYTNQQIDALAVASIDGLQDALNLKANKTEIPTAVSTLTNDANYTNKNYVDGAIETALANADTYTKAEVNQIVANAVAAVKAEIVANLTVTSDIPMHFSVNENGGLVITYDDGSKV